MSENKSKGNNKNKIFYEGKRQKPSPLHVSLDNADTVIEGGPSGDSASTTNNLEVGAPSGLILAGWVF